MKPIKNLRAWINAHPRLMVAASLLAFMGVGTVAFRSAIPFGTASSWSSAVNADPNAVRGPWFNNNEHALTHTNTGGSGTDWQLDNIVYSVQAFGCKGDGVTDDTVCIQNTINAAKATNSSGSVGAIVYFPAGVYVFTSQLSLSDSKNVTLRGAGGFGIGTPPPSSTLKYTGTGATSAINAQTTYGVVFDTLGITYSSASFTGYLIDFSHSAANFDTAFDAVNNCYVGAYGEAALSSAAALISLQDAVSCSVRNSHFMGAKIGILFRPNNADYSNAHVVTNCTFQDFATAAIADAGQNCSIQHCTFENNPIIGTPTMAPAYLQHNAISAPNAFDFSFNWVGDGDDSTFEFDTGTGTGILGLTMLNNYIFGTMRLASVRSGLVSGNMLTGNGSTSPAITFNVSDTGLLIMGNSIGAAMTLTGLPQTNDVNLVGNTGFVTANTLNDQIIYKDNFFYKTSTQADGATAVGATFDTSTAWADSGARLMVWKNNAVTKAEITAAGLVFAGGYDAETASQINIGVFTATGITMLKSGALLTLQGNITSTSSTGIATFQHYGGRGTAPTVAVGNATQLGTSPAAAITQGSDTDFVVTVTTGTGPAAFAANTAITAATVTYNSTYTTAPLGPLCVPAGATAAALSTGASGIAVYADYAGAAATTLPIKLISSGTPTIAASTAYNFICHTFK